MKLIKNKKKQDVNIFENNSMNLFLMLSEYFGLVLILYSISSILGFRNILGLIEALSVTIPIVIYLIKYKQKSIKAKVTITIIFLFLLVIVPFAYSKTFDLTIDGNTYHKSSIAYIKNGWNPVYESTSKFQKTNDKVVKINKDTRMDLWMEHYPKATWILAATIYNLTGNIESGKCITLILSIMLLIISYNCLQTILSKKWSAVIAIIVALNPITLAQLFSYYLDGIVGVCFIIQLLLLFLIKPNEKQDLKIWIPLLSIILIFVNLKFTGLLYSGIISAVFYFYWLFKYKKEKDFMHKFLIITRNFVIVYLMAILLVGANSYVKNTIEHHNPLYPLIGKDKVDIITTMEPRSYVKAPMAKKFINSLFSKTDNILYASGKKPELKLPIRIYRSELDILYCADVRIGGFGPFFGLITIVSLLLLIPSTILLYKNEKDKMKYPIITTLVVIISMIAVGENWWARYVPQFYLLPVGALITFMYTSKYMKNKIVKKYTHFTLIVCIAINLACFMYIDYKELQSFTRINNGINEMKNTKNLELALTTPDLYGYIYVLNDNNVQYKLLDKIEPKDIIYKYEWRIEVKKQ